MTRIKTSWYLAVGAALLMYGARLPFPAWAIQSESPAEKEANFKQQALGELFHRWTFDQQTPEDALTG